jgi:hypothetical protein
MPQLNFLRGYKYVGLQQAYIKFGKNIYNPLRTLTVLRQSR